MFGIGSENIVAKRKINGNDNGETHQLQLAENHNEMVSQEGHPAVK